MSILNRNHKPENLFFHFVPSTNEAKSLKLSDTLENSNTKFEHVNVNKVFKHKKNASFILQL